MRSVLRCVVPKLQSFKTMDKNNTIQFLECYEKHSCLWNPREQDYKNNNVRLAALKSIIEEMRLTITVQELKVKIKNIRTTYNREASKVAMSKKSGAGTDDIYKPQLIWFSTADRFLKPVIEGRQSKDNMPKESEDSTVSTNSDASSSYFDELGQVSSTARRKKKVSPKKSTARAQRMDPPVLQAVDRLEPLVQNIHQDEFDTFGQHVANQLRSLPLANAIMCQDFINNYLSQQRLKNLNAQSPTTPIPRSSLSEYTCSSASPGPSRNRPTSRSMSSTSEYTCDNPGPSTSRIYEEDYFAGCLPTEENTGQQHEVNDDILSQAVRSCLDENISQNDYCVLK